MLSSIKFLFISTIYKEYTVRESRMEVKNKVGKRSQAEIQVFVGRVTWLLR